MLHADGQADITKQVRGFLSSFTTRLKIYRSMGTLTVCNFYFQN